MPLVSRIEPLWTRLRPAYEASLRFLYGRRGLLRVVNGSERIRLDPLCRNVRADYEPAVWPEAVGAVRPGDVVVDVGANIGLYSVAFSRRTGPTGRVIAYEPEPRNASLLRRTIALNTAAVEVREVAVGAQTGRIPFRSDLQRSRFDPKATVTVQVVALDDEFERIDVLKIDVEGYETEVLDGTSRLLNDPAHGPRAVFLETHLNRLPALGHSEPDVLDRLRRAGYVVNELTAALPLTRNYRGDRGAPVV